MLWFSYMNWFSKILFLPQQTGRKEEKSTALPLDGVLTSPTLKLNLKQSSDRPAIFFSANSYTIDLFFFLDKALKMPGDSDVLSHQTVQIQHTHSCWGPVHPFGNSTTSSVFGRRKDIFIWVPTCLKEERPGGSGLKVGDLWSGGLWAAVTVVISERSAGVPPTPRGRCRGAQPHVHMASRAPG